MTTRVLLVGPLVEGSMLTDLLTGIENSGLHVDVIPTLLRPPVSHYVMGLMGQTVVAPYDVAIVVHDLGHTFIDEDVFTAAKTLMSFVTLTQQVDVGKYPDSTHAEATLDARLRAFHFVIPNDEPTALALQGHTDKITQVCSVADFAEFLNQIPHTVADPPEGADLAASILTRGFRFDRTEEPFTYDAEGLRGFRAYWLRNSA